MSVTLSDRRMLRFLSVVFPILALLSANHTYDCLIAGAVKLGRHGYQHVVERTSAPFTYWTAIAMMIALTGYACVMSVRIANIAWRQKA